MLRLAPLALAAALLAAPGRADAQGRPFGLGVILGNPTGISAKAYLARAHAIDAAVGAAFLHGSGLHIHADYLWHPVILAEDEAFTLPLYIGIGGRMLIRGREGIQGDKFHLGPRVPVGFLFDFKQIPIDVFVEVALIVDVIRTAGDDVIDVNGGIGVRYYF
ncbi:MAG TPA: hypothetical protein VKE22_02565 [Haliangiales bacterium]|nr:hypothetical protein [Haliangiales bacterium]